MRPLPTLIVCLASFFTSVCSLSCLPCREVTCELPAAVTHCSWGFVLDMCGCCYVCGKGPGETCGGQWAWHGRCGRDLDCRRPHELSSVARRRQEEVGGGNVLALLNMDEPSRCHRRTDSVADRLNTFFTWISSLFRTTARDD